LRDGLLARFTDGKVRIRHSENRATIVVPHDGLTGVADVYEGALAGLVIVEIEGERVNQTLSLPSWVGREVTGDPRFRKGNLQRNPLPDLD